MVLDGHNPPLEAHAIRRLGAGKHAERCPARRHLAARGRETRLLLRWIK